MEYIDEKFKDAHPEDTVNKIIAKLDSIGITLEEHWNDSLIDNCCSLHVTTQNGAPYANGKGITKAFARASAYGEFIERLQSGLFFYKYQSFEKDESVYLHAFAPDKRYMSKDELLENSEWMEPIAEKYGITKENIANQCLIYGESDQVLTLPFYSLFEDKYVYLPAGFVEHIYSANGCCVGNTREEAWVHALSEIFERHSNIEVMKSGKAMPVISREELKNFKAVNAILDKIDAEGIYDIQIFDYSCGKKFPVIAARMINKKTKGYLVNVGADPVFEIAVERTLTEIFQGRNLKNFTSKHGGAILNSTQDIRLADNIINQLEMGNGLYTVDFFADDCDQKNAVADFPDNASKTNTQLLAEILELYKALHLPVYVRNCSFLDFPCYKFVVPGFSESRGERLKETIPTYYFASRAAETLKNIRTADSTMLSELLTYHGMISNYIARVSDFRLLAGIPLKNTDKSMVAIHMAYAALKINNSKLFNTYMAMAIANATENKKDYLMAVKQWVAFERSGVPKEKALAVIKKFYYPETVTKLEENLQRDALLDEFLMECTDCNCCKDREFCSYKSICELIAAAGKEYAKFVNGQNRENFQ